MNAWALFQYDATLKENRLIGVYLDGADANTDALALSNETMQPTVEPFTIHVEPQYTSREPATEKTDADFDVPVHVDGEVTSVS